MAEIVKVKFSDVENITGWSKEQEPPKPLPRRHFVYLMGISYLGSYDSFLKIGMSINPRTRMYAFRDSMTRDLLLLATIELPSKDEARQLERHLHHRFHHSRQYGEFFHWTVEIREFCKALGIASQTINIFDIGRPSWPNHT